MSAISYIGHGVDHQTIHRESGDHEYEFLCIYMAVDGRKVKFTFGPSGDGLVSPGAQLLKLTGFRSNAANLNVAAIESHLSSVKGDFDLTDVYPKEGL